MSEVESRDTASDAETPGDTEEAARPKVKVPQARDIARGDFTPHALGAKGRRAPRSGTRAAARRRRIVYGSVGTVLAAAAVVGLVLYATRPGPSVKVRGAFGKAPTFSVPKAKPAAKKQVKELIHGAGVALTNNDFVVVQLVGYRWNASGGKQLLNTYSRGMPVAGPESRITGLTALDKALAGRRTGSRVQLTLPYRDVDAQIAQQLQLARTDDFVVTADVVAAFSKKAAAQGTPRKLDDKKLPAVTPGAPGKPPAIKIPSATEPSTLQTRTLIQGSGPVVTKGKTLIVQYHGVVWRTGKVFDSTWQRGTPAALPIGVGQFLPGWDKGLVGQRVGSRVLLVVPPKDGYGPNGTPDGKVTGTDTLVYVVDILGAL